MWLRLLLQKANGQVYHFSRDMMRRIHLSFRDGVVSIHFSKCILKNSFFMRKSYIYAP